MSIPQFMQVSISYDEKVGILFVKYGVHTLQDAKLFAHIVRELAKDFAVVRIDPLEREEPTT